LGGWFSAIPKILKFKPAHEQVKPILMSLVQKINSYPLGGTRSAWHRRRPPKRRNFFGNAPRAPV